MFLFLQKIDYKENILFLQEDHGKHLFFSLTNKYDDDIALLKKVNKRCKQMPTTETVRTDYRRKKKK